MNHQTDTIEDRLRADAPPLATDVTPAAVDLCRRAAARRRQKTAMSAVACCGLIAATYALLPEQRAAGPVPDALIVQTPDPPAEEAVEVDLVVNAAGVLEVRARRGDVFCAIPLDEPAPEETLAEPAARAVPFWQIEPAVQDRFIEVWIDAGQMTGLEV